MDFELACFQMFVGSARKWGRGCNHTYMFNTITKNVDEFLNEVEAMARIHHRNILQLKGCCLFKNKFLVHESFENNLENALLGNTLIYKIKNKEYDNNGLILVHHKKENC